jgi:signal transduction histidine kinase
VKFTPESGRIDLRVEQAGRDLMFSVRDTGPGIPPEALHRLFEPYWQVSKTRSGLGLGLFIARTLVKAHGGRIWVESKLDEGTIFYFTLPSIAGIDSALNRASSGDQTIHPASPSQKAG